MKLDKNLFYDYLKPFTNKHLPIFFDMPINKWFLNYRLIFSWTPRKPNGEFNPYMSAQLIDTTKTVGKGKYIVPDLYFNCVTENVTTDYKLYKYLNAWIENAFKSKENK